MEDEELAYHETCTPGTMACDIARLYTEDGGNDLYYHDGVGTYGDLEAGDNSYRYTGANPNNYVCFGSDAETCSGDNLYRIIGVFNDASQYQVKLIKEDYVTSTMLGTNSRDYYGSYVTGWGEEETYKGNMVQSDVAAYKWNNDISVSEFGSANWVTSELNNTNLNTNYLNYLGEPWSNLIADTTWHLGGISENDFFGTVKNYYNAERNNAGYGDNPIISNGKIGLMYASDYGYANDSAMWEETLVESVKSDNWMYMGMREWTITTISWSGYNAICVESYEGNFDIPNTVIGYAVRPTFYLESSVVLNGGSGTSTDPYRIQI